MLGKKNLIVKYKQSKYICGKSDRKDNYYNEGGDKELKITMLKKILENKSHKFCSVASTGDIASGEIENGRMRSDRSRPDNEF